MPSAPAAFCVLVALALLAGCALPEDAPPGAGEEEAQAAARAAAQAQLAEAIGRIPDALTLDGQVFRGSKLLLTLNGTFDQASQMSYLALEADPQTLEALSGGQVSGGLLGSRVAIYSTKEGDLFLRNATGFLFTGAARSGPLNPGASLRAAPMGGILEGGPYVRELLQGAEVTSATPTTHAGQEALQVVAEVENATVAVLLLPAEKRIAHVETTLPTDPAKPGDPLAGATLVADLAEAPRAPPERALRAMSLLHTTTASIFGGDPHRVEWTFLGAPRVPLAEAVVLGRASNLDLLAGDPQGGALWTFALAQTEADLEGVHLAFEDRDGDGLVGAGDTLVATAEGDDQVPHLLLSDGTTGVVLLAVAG